MNKELKYQIIDECFVPKNIKVDYEVMSMCIVTQLPFVPYPGTMLCVTPEGDILKVEEIYIDASNPDALIQVWIDQDDEDKRTASYEELIEQGWKALDGEDNKLVKKSTLRNSLTVVKDD